MFDSISPEPVKIRHASADGSGALVWTESEAQGILLNSQTELHPETSGIVNAEKVFLIFAENAPIPGDILVWQSGSGEIRAVRIFRSFTGKTIAYRCVC